MSPAHVERYIGSCLITSGYKPPRYRRYPPDYGPATPYQAGGWAGLPLIAATVAPRKKEDRSPLSRLAIHTQGAPLIQSGRGGQGRRQPGKQQADHRKQPQQNPPPKETDEPANSENSLPRIIKPRKRRKKERKPQQESSIVTLKPYTPLCAEIPGNGTVSASGNEQSSIPAVQHESSRSESHQTQSEEHSRGTGSGGAGAAGSVGVQVPGGPENPRPSMIGSDERIAFGRRNQQQLLLGPPQQQQAQLQEEPQQLQQPQLPLQIQIQQVRSNSESSSDSGVVADCQCRYCDPLGVIWEARTPAAWPAVSSPYDSSNDDSASTGSSGLEVSSEIVTSPNGHRDIEIRFFTTPPPQQRRPQPVVVSPPWR